MIFVTIKIQIYFLIVLKKTVMDLMDLYFNYCLLILVFFAKTSK